MQQAVLQPGLIDLQPVRQHEAAHEAAAGDAAPASDADTGNDGGPAVWWFVVAGVVVVVAALWFVLRKPKA